MTSPAPMHDGLEQSPTWSLSQAKQRLREQGEVVERDLDAKVDQIAGRIRAEIKKAGMWAALGALGLGLSFGSRGGRRRGHRESGRDASAAPHRGGVASWLWSAGRFTLPFIVQALRRRSQRQARTGVDPTRG